MECCLTEVGVVWMWRGEGNGYCLEVVEREVGVV